VEKIQEAIVKRKIKADMLRAFELALQNEERSAATVEKYMRDVRGFAAYVQKDTVDRQEILSYKSELGRRYAVSSANSMLAAINRFFRFCGWHDLCVKRFHTQRVAYCSEDKELTRAEYVRLLRAAKTRRDRRLHLIIQTICATGIRVSELTYITVEAVRRGEAVVDCKGKRRRIFIVPELRKKLLRYAEEHKVREGSVFVTRSGRPVSRTHIWKGMKSLCEAANVSPTKVFPHNLRRLFARTFYGIEKDIAKLADILGHASIDTTRIYITTTGAEHRRKMELLRLII
jgi:site-specific recombinase XerD